MKKIEGKVNVINKISKRKILELTLIIILGQKYNYCGIVLKCLNH